jgi:hypothetical protein
VIAGGPGSPNLGGAAARSMKQGRRSSKLLGCVLGSENRGHPRRVPQRQVGVTVERILNHPHPPIRRRSAQHPRGIVAEAVGREVELHHAKPPHSP